MDAPVTALSEAEEGVEDGEPLQCHEAVYITKDGDVGAAEEMSFEQMKEHAAKDTRVVGFTFRGDEAEPHQPVTVWFKSKGHDAGDRGAGEGWFTYLVPGRSTPPTPVPAGKESAAERNCWGLSSSGIGVPVGSMQHW